MWLRIRLSYVARVLGPTSCCGNQRSSRKPKLAFVRDVFSASASASSRVSAFSASRSVSTVSCRMIRSPVAGSVPAETLACHCP
jgi:hypothetical protein